MCASFPWIYTTGILVKECQEKEVGNVGEEKILHRKDPLSSLFLSFHSFLLYFCHSFTEGGTKSLSCKHT